MKENPHHPYGSSKAKEVYYLLQAEEPHPGWHYIGGHILAPGVPTVTRIGPDHSWVLTFAGYDPKDATFKPGTKRYMANYRQPFFVHLDVKIPKDKSVEMVSERSCGGGLRLFMSNREVELLHNTGSGVRCTCGVLLLVEILGKSAWQSLRASKQCI